MVGAALVTACTQPVDSPDITWEESIEGTIELEGMEEPITLHLFEGDSFVTYVPEDLTAELETSDRADNYWFFANYGEVKNEDVYLKLSLFHEAEEEPNLIGEEGKFTLQGLDMETVEEDEKIYQWSLEEYRGKDGVGYGALGKHQDKYFSLLIHYYPLEFGDGFEPRANKIIEHLYWTDTDEYLTE